MNHTLHRVKSMVRALIIHIITSNVLTLRRARSCSELRHCQTGRVHRGDMVLQPFWNIPSVVAITADEKARVNIHMSYVNVCKPPIYQEGTKTDGEVNVYKIPCMTNSRAIVAGELLRQAAKRKTMELHDEDEKVSKKLKLSCGAASSAPKSSSSSAPKSNSSSAKGRGKKGRAAPKKK